MQPTTTFIAEVLRQSARAYAAQAATGLLDEHEASAAAWGRGAFRMWQDLLTQVLVELAVALELEEPQIFATQLQWNREAFEARDVPVEHLRWAMASLIRTLESDLPEGGGPMVRGVVERALASLDETPPGRHGLSARDDHGRLALMFLEAAMGGRRRHAIGVVTSAVKAGLSITDAYERVLLPAQAEIGRMWHLGEVRVGEEHVATETTRTAMSVLSQGTPVRDGPGSTVLVTAAEGDRHDVGPRAVADLFELAGFNAVCLGGDVPVDELVRSVEDFKPALLVMSATVCVHLAKLRRGVQAVREAEPGVRVIVGGPAFLGSASLAEKVGADVLAGSPSEAVRLGRELLSGGGPATS